MSGMIDHDDSSQFHHVITSGLVFPVSLLEQAGRFATPLFSTLITSEGIMHDRVCDIFPTTKLEKSI
jgi:hypothetical protein